MHSYRRYKAEDYPLVPIDLANLPSAMSEMLEFIHQTTEYAIQGGAASCLLTDRIGVVTDLDVFVKISAQKLLVEQLAEFAEHFYLCQNHFGNDVATFFWASLDGYHKIEVCFRDSLPENEFVNYSFGGQHYDMTVVSCPWLWLNKLEKVGRNYKRPITREKILGHAAVVISLGESLLSRNKMNLPISINHLCQLIDKAVSRLTVLDSSEILTHFQSTLGNVLTRHRTES